MGFWRWRRHEFESDQLSHELYLVMFAGLAMLGAVNAMVWAFVVPDGPALATLAPGLVYLVAFAGLASGDVSARRAALVAGALGAARVLGPALVYAWSEPGVVVTVDGTLLIVREANGLSAALWLATLAAVPVLVWRGDRAPREPSWNERRAAGR